VDEDQLERVAQELVLRVRDDEPDGNGRWLAAVTDEHDRWALLFILAAAVPDDRSWKHLTLWTYGLGGPDTDDAVQARRRVLLEETDGRAGIGSNQYRRRRRAA